ncbi:MAG TPA: YidC/Oxa1 family membrane protein insertase, partial [Firmicutes bacterium]|nr:YidC/Oxa1 family membrane protein insertase [Bacillota bacterium]
MSYIMDAMLHVIDFLYGLTGSWGLSIIGLTVLVRLLILPITIMQGRSAQRMAIIQPELEKIQKKYKDDPERLNLEIMDIYRRNKANPASSCILPLIQLPVLWAMIRALEAHPAMKEGVFLGLKLGEPAMQQGRIYGVIVIAITIGTTYLAMRLSPSMGAGTQQGQSQNVMMIGMLA